MIKLEQVDGTEVIVCSQYDKGTLVGVTVNIWEGYDVKTLDKVLTKEQIKGLERIIAYTVDSYMRENSENK